MRCCSTSCPPAGGWPDDRLQPCGAARTVRRSAAAGAFLCSAEQRALPHFAAGFAQADDAPGMHFRAGAGRAGGGRRRVAGGRRRLERRVGARCVGWPPPAARQPVAQSLAAHGGQWWAPTLRSRRITRIATLPALRRQGIARQLVERQRRQAQGLDFLSVSFGYTEPLWRFWQSCGFELVRIGSKPEASGCYTAMAILPLSEQGEALRHAAHKHLARDWPRCGSVLNSRWRSGRRRRHAAGRRGLARAGRVRFRPSAAGGQPGALQRLLLASNLPLPTLRGHLQRRQSPAACAELAGVSGQKALLRHWRHEAAQALEQLNAQHCRYWRDWTQSLQ